MKNFLNRIKSFYSSEFALILMVALTALVLFSPNGERPQSNDLYSPGNTSVIGVYPTYYAAQAFLAGQSDAIYPVSLWIHEHDKHPYWAKMVKDYGADFGTSFLYHPAYLWLWLPIVKVCSFENFIWIIKVLNLLSVLFIGAESFRWIGSERVISRYAKGSFALFTLPAFYGFMIGQNSAIGFALILLGLRCFEKNGVSSLVGGALFLVALTFKPWFFVLIGVFFLTGHHRRGVLITLASFVLFVVAPFLWEPTLMSRFIEKFVDMSQSSLTAFANLSLNGFLLRMASADWRSGAGVFDAIQLMPYQRIVPLAVASLIALMALYQILRHRPTEKLIWMASFNLLLLPLSILWNHYLVLAFPSLIALTFNRFSTRGARILGGLGFGVLCFATCLFQPVFFDWMGTYGLAFYYLTAYIFLAIIAWVVLRQNLIKS